MRPADSFFIRIAFTFFLCVLICAAQAAAQDYGYAQADVPMSIADAGAKVQAVLTRHPVTGAALGRCDGLAVDADGNVFFSDPAGGSIFKVTPSGQASVFYSGPESPNGLDFDPQGRLVACAKGLILRFGKDGRKDTLAASGGAIDFKTLKDISIGSNGSMYVDNGAGATIFSVSADGKTVKAISGVGNPEGIQWIEEHQALYVAGGDVNTLYRFDVAADGSLANKNFLSGKPNIPGCDGLAFDERYEFFVAGRSQGAVHGYSPNNQGPFLGHILIKGTPTPDGNNINQAFGGGDFKTLYVTGNGGCFKIHLNVAGRRRPGASAAIRAATRTGLGAKSAPRFDRRAGFGASQGMLFPWMRTASDAAGRMQPRGL